MNEKRKIVNDSYTAGDSPFGFGDVTGTFEAFRYGNDPLLDTHVELEVTPFSVSWSDRQKVINEIAAVIHKYQI